MKITVPILAGLVGSLAMTSGASALVASTTAVIQNISASFAGQPLYVGLQTYAVFVSYQGAGDVMVNHGLASIHATSGSFFQMTQVGAGGDPFGFDDAFTGLLPVTLSAAALTFSPQLAPWLWDSNLSLDNHSFNDPIQPSVSDPGSSGTALDIIGGAFSVPPPIGVTAGADLMIQVAQITMNTTGTAHGTTMVNTVNPAGGNPIVTQITIDIIPGPGALALLGVAGLVGTRRRRA